MAVISNGVQTPAQQNSESLNQTEIAFLLNLIKNSQFYGRDLEAVYNTVIKLQIQYTNQQPK